MMVGGTLSYYSINYSNSETRNTISTFTPGFGYFVKDNFAVGLNLSMGRNSSTSAVSQLEMNFFGFGPFVRYYRFTSNPEFAFYVQGGFSLLSQKTEYAPDMYQRGRSFSFQIYPGFSYFFTKHWAADLSIRGILISSDNPDNENGSDYTVVDFGIGTFSPSLGLRYYFGNN
jgi:opacity protein-like surface antigen